MDRLIRRAALAFTLIVAPLAARADQILPTPQIDNTGNLKFRGGPTLGKVTGGVLDLAGQAVTPSGRSVATPLSTRFSKQKLISDYGPAAGDGTDATAAFTAAMADTMSPTIAIPEGTYNLSGCPQLTAASAVSFVGAASGKTTLRFSTANASCPGGALFRWVSRAGVTVRGLSVDFNGANYSGGMGDLAAGLAFVDTSRVLVDDVNLYGANPVNFDYINGNGGSVGRITNSRFAFPSCSTTYNHAISIGNSVSALYSWTYDHNVIVNTGTFAAPTFGLEASFNDIGGDCYGAPIAIAQNNAPTGVRITGNALHDTGTAADQDATVPSGIENWGVESVVTNNRIWNVGSSCAFIGGARSHVSGNYCRSWGKGLPTSDVGAYLAGYFSGTQSGSNSVFSNNVAAQDGQAGSQRGLVIAANVSGVVATNNPLTGSVSAYLDSGAGTTIVDPVNVPLAASQGGTGNTGGAWTSYTPTVTITGGSGVTVPIAGYYQLIGKTLRLHLSAQANFSSAPTQLAVSLPAGLTVRDIQAANAANISSSTVLLAISNSATTITITGGTGSLASASGQILALNFEGEVQ